MDEITEGLTIDQFWAKIKQLGLVRHSEGRTSVYKSLRTNDFVHVLDPVTLTAAEREDEIRRLGELCD
ncbi:hypothetical protein [Salinarimonas ramus]|uniref:Uncharacterized protein n=1 Tax=Salinarimonas ramus TaxID=690164 RepID=A0A917V1E3_9HYPH|nr:hypothetical protein [Salinarimonas ramus]GGK18751.1 hypothetical protein GCM10011322_01820 [Salinarimonas ramus]